MQDHWALDFIKHLIVVDIKTKFEHNQKMLIDQIREYKERSASSLKRHSFNDNNNITFNFNF